ncbi:helix-turn-helix transcriptional regulator [Vibrio sp. M260118]|uniref:helix-turn-helix transcriptional regulator n=1 Tax=Vibrio sp. M260118 TaxID=3020896 RepID=UPI002F4078D4
MNDCSRLSATAMHLSTFELEQMLEVELAKLGLDHFVVMIIDARQQPVYQYVCGFTETQMNVYEQNMAHDVFLQHYADIGLIGQLTYMQEMLPMRRIDNPIFNEILVPTMQLYHSYCGLAPLMERHCLMLSSHGDRSLGYRSRFFIESVWRFLQTWGNYWIAHKAMSAQLVQFDSLTDKRLMISNLTVAESNVLNMLAQGLDGSEVARRRNVSKETVRSQIKHILHKTGCRHQNELLARYFQSGLQSSTEFISLSPQSTELI